MRVIVAAILVIGLFASLGVAAPPPFREMPDLDISVFGCAPNPTHRIIKSQAARSEVFTALAPHCPATLFEKRKAAFLRDLADARLNWTDEALVIIMDWYGTGMAKPSLVFAGQLTAFSRPPSTGAFHRLLSPRTLRHAVSPSQ